MPEESDYDCDAAGVELLAVLERMMRGSRVINVCTV